MPALPQTTSSARIFAFAILSPLVIVSSRGQTKKQVLPRLKLRSSNRPTRSQVVKLCCHQGARPRGAPRRREEQDEEISIKRDEVSPRTIYHSWRNNNEKERDVRKKMKKKKYGTSSQPPMPPYCIQTTSAMKRS
jgi:hypothetical protein